MRNSGGQIITSVTAAGRAEVENLVCARQEVVLTCSVQEPCEERTVIDPIFYLMREPRVRELVGLPAPHSGLAPHLFHFPSGFQSPGFQACPCHCLACQTGIRRPSPRYESTESGRRCGWCGQRCSQGTENGPVLTNWICTCNSCELKEVSILFVPQFPRLAKQQYQHHGIT